MATRAEFIQKYSPLVKALSEKTGIFPETVFAQAIIESSDSKGNFGKGYNVTAGNNYFGIRPSKGWTGDVITNPHVTSESKLFRGYDSAEDSIADYFKFLLGNKRYKAAGVFTAADYKEQAKALQKAGYAGNSTTYAALIGKVGDVVKKVMSGAKEFVSEHKAAAGIGVGTILTIAAVAGFALYSSRKTKRA